MPRRDGTGPMGQGARTGRGLGNCQGNEQNANIGLGQGRGRLKNNGRGNGQGLGLGFRHGLNATTASEQEN